MNSFNKIKNIWSSQSLLEMADVPAALQDRIRRADKGIGRFHVNTIIVLVTTMILITVGYLLLFKLQSLVSVSGISIMNIALMVRVVFEWESYNRMRKLDWLRPLPDFCVKLEKYYNWRIKVHKLPTWLTFGSYVVGVIMLFVIFYDSLSKFWFWFFVIEFIVIVLILSYLIRRWIRKEMKLYQELIVDYRRINN